LYIIFESLITKPKVSPLKAMPQAHNYNVLIIIFCILYDRLALYVVLNCIFLLMGFSIIFQAIQNHHCEQCTSEVSQLKQIIHYLSALIYQPNFIIGLITITLKISIYRPILIWWLIYRASLPILHEN